MTDFRVIRGHTGPILIQEKRWFRLTLSDGSRPRTLAASEEDARAKVEAREATHRGRVLVAIEPERPDWYWTTEPTPRAQ